MPTSRTQATLQPKGGQAAAGTFAGAAAAPPLRAFTTKQGCGEELTPLRGHPCCPDRPHTKRRQTQQIGRALKLTSSNTPQSTPRRPEPGGQSGRGPCSQDLPGEGQLLRRRGGRPDCAAFLRRVGLGSPSACAPCASVSWLCWWSLGRAGPPGVRPSPGSVTQSSRTSRGTARPWVFRGHCAASQGTGPRVLCPEAASQTCFCHPCPGAGPRFLAGVPKPPTLSSSSIASPVK